MLKLFSKIVSEDIRWHLWMQLRQMLWLLLALGLLADPRFGPPKPRLDWFVSSMTKLLLLALVVCEVMAVVVGRNYGFVFGALAGVIAYEVLGLLFTCLTVTPRFRKRVLPTLEAA